STRKDFSAGVLAELDLHDIALRPELLLNRRQLYERSATSMRVRLTDELERLAVEFDASDATPWFTDSIPHFQRTAAQCHFDAQAIELRRHHRVHAQHFGLAAQTQEAPEGKAQRDAGAAGVDPPAAIQVDGAARDPVVLLTGLVPVLERRIRARVVTVR